MELIPQVIPGFGHLYRISLHGKKARDLAPNALIASHLFKVSGALVRSWEKRFVVLLPTQVLLYFESPEDVEPRGIFCLDRDSAVNSLGIKDGRSAFEVRPLPTIPSARSLQFAADTPEEETEWREALFSTRVEVMRNGEKSISAARDSAVARNSSLELELSSAKSEVATLREDLIASNARLQAAEKKISDILQQLDEAHARASEAAADAAVAKSEIAMHLAAWNAKEAEIKAEASKKEANSKAAWAIKESKITELFSRVNGALKQERERAAKLEEELAMLRASSTNNDIMAPEGNNHTGSSTLPPPGRRASVESHPLESVSSASAQNRRGSYTQALMTLLAGDNRKRSSSVNDNSSYAPPLSSLLVSDPYRGRLHVLIMGARHLPPASFSRGGTFAAPRSVCVHLQFMSGNTEEFTLRAADVVDKGPNRGLCAAFHEAVSLRLIRALENSPLQLDLAVAPRGLLRGGARLGGAILDPSPLANWPRQPHAVWLVLHTEQVTQPDSAEILVPVRFNVRVPPGVAGAALGMDQLTLENDTSTGTTDEVDGRWASPELPPPPVDNVPCVLVQMVYCPSPEEPVLFHLPLTGQGLKAATKTNAPGNSPPLLSPENGEPSPAVPRPGVETDSLSEVKSKLVRLAIAYKKLKAEKEDLEKKLNGVSQATSK
jgi:PH domain